MKKIFFIAVFLVFFFVLTGCTGHSPGNTQNTTTPSVPVTPAETTGTPPDMPTPIRPTVPVTTIQTLFPAITETPVPTVSSDRIRSLVQDCKIRLNAQVSPDNEYACIINATTGYELPLIPGNTYSVSVPASFFNHEDEYIILHLHPHSQTEYRNLISVTLFTFSLQDLYLTGYLAENGIKIRSIHVVGYKDFDLSPNVPFAWKNQSEIETAIQRIEADGESYHTLDPAGNVQYDVDNLMPVLANSLNYTYVSGRN